MKMQNVKNWVLNVVATLAGLIVAVASIAGMSYAFGGISFGDASGLALLFVMPLYLVCAGVSLLVLKIKRIEVSPLFGFCMGSAQALLLLSIMLALSSVSLHYFFESLMKTANVGITIAGGLAGFTLIGVLKFKK
jgi:hypothetical protein